MRLFVSGATGTLGHELAKYGKDMERFVVFSRDEFKQNEMRKQFPEGGKRGIRYMLGDVRNEKRLKQAMQGCDCVIHAAAMKQVPLCEYNPQEAVATNVLGTMNVINVCNAVGIERCVVISSDKAVQPINLYGSTKMCGEKMAIAANNLGKCRFSVVRYGNVWGSRGSVVPLWRKQAEEGGVISVTNPDMTRFWITIEDAAKFILACLTGKMEGGEIFVPKMRHSTMQAVALEIAPNATVHDIGIRPGEKMHECLVGEGDARDCQETDSMYIIYPAFHEWTEGFDRYGTQVPEDFRYASNS